MGKTGPKPRPVAERFWKFVEKTDNCWIWTGNRLPSGYGLISDDGSHGGGLVYAHRWAYESTYGPIPKGMYVLHQCDNPPCVRPDHLFIGTQSDNMRDCAAKGRHVPGMYKAGSLDGERHPMARFTNEQVEQIRNEYSTGKHTTYSIAARYGVAQSTISKIIRRSSYK